MSLDSSVKFLMRFDDLPLTEEVSSKQLTIKGEQSVSLAADGLGLSMKRDQHSFVTGLPLGISKKMSIGFWIFPTNEGVSKNPANGQPEPMRVSLFDFGIGDLDKSTNSVNITRQSITAYEETQIDGKNKMVLRFIDTGDNEFTAKTSSYEVGKWHFIWAAWNGITGDFKFFLDGEEDVALLFGDIPSLTLGVSVGAVSINRTVFDQQHDVLNHNGFIDELMILSNYVATTSTIQKVVNFSVDYAFDSTFSNTEEYDFAFLFNDPTPIRITDMHNDGTYLFASRNDGTVLRGSPLIWDVRRDFSDENEEPVTKTFGDGVSFENGFLNITDGSVRL